MTAPRPAGAGTAPSPLRSRITAQPVWRLGVLVAVAGAAVTEVFALGARGLGVPMEAASPGAAAAQEIPLFGFAFGVLFNSVVGIVLAVALARWAKRPARIFLVTTVVLTALSLIPPALAPHTAVLTQVVLALSHLVAAAVIIPPLTLRLKHAEGR
ncbi:hypothetical protein DB35_10425 [Streptomyces abyssalis]|uniref:Uncharacterized protein n=2 Tax=Streptomyces abyssalis TaxID=933944 RepID=A0A1E7JIY8_9ACTN|nr:hypothetical protein AN215_27475 [Streptomyces abyssalis]OEU93209.1 hypothetical protein DB35_10425 [Streptomyces abyssalis]